MKPTVREEEEGQRSQKGQDVIASESGRSLSTLTRDGNSRTHGIWVKLDEKRRGLAIQLDDIFFPLQIKKRGVCVAHQRSIDLHRTADTKRGRVTQ